MNDYPKKYIVIIYDLRKVLRNEILSWNRHRHNVNQHSRA